MLVVLYLIFGGAFTYLVGGLAMGANGRASSWLLVAGYLTFGVGGLVVWLIARDRAQLLPDRFGYWLAAGMALAGACVPVRVLA